MRRLILAVAVVAMLSSCGSSGSGVSVSGDTRNVSDVTVSLRVEPSRVSAGRSSRFTLRVLNVSGRPKTLTFNSGKRYDFWVTSKSGEELWRWSSGKSFIQSIETLELQGQGAEVFAEPWTPPAAGAYEVHAELAAEGYEGTLTAPLTVDEDR